MIDIVIIGGGVAGMTAAIYAKRGGKNVLLIEKECCGGALSRAPLVENFPGYKPTPGVEITSAILEQVELLDIPVEYQEVKEINYDYGTSSWNILADEAFNAQAVIIASGTSYKKLHSYNGEEFIEGDDVCYCAVCDGALYKNQEVSIIGDGNSALQYAVMLSQICSKVNLCTLGNNFFGDDALVQKIKQISNIVHIPYVSVYRYQNKELVLNSVLNNERIIVHSEGLFVAIGQQPNTDFLNNTVYTNNQGYISNCDTVVVGSTGLFVAGDCRAKSATRQAITAASDGAIAAVKAIEFLNNKN
jgi:thioredoxin reductase (NADPH)